MSKIDQLINQLCPDGVEYKTLGALGDFFGGLTGKSKDDFKDGNAKFITYKNVYTNPALKTDVSDRVRIHDGERQRSLEYGDILFTGSSETPDECGFSSVLTTRTDEKLYLNSFCFIFRLHDLKLFNLDFLKHLFRSGGIRYQIGKTASGVTRFNVSKKLMRNVRIPIPPLDVQSEIVRILDNFTELTAELASRKRQYEYYRDTLLSFDGRDDFEMSTIGSLSNYRRGSFPQPYGNREWYDGDGAMPFVQVADIGDDMLLAPDTKRKISKIAQPKSVFAPAGSIIISLQGSIGRIAITQYDAFIDRTVAIFQDIDKKILPKYFVYQLQRIFAIKEKTARGSTIKTITKEEFTSFPIPIPSIEEQKRVVSILDRFNKLCSDVAEGLPAEIIGRNRQYEYYREKLLTFKELKAA